MPKKPSPGQTPNYGDLKGDWYSISTLEGGPPASDSVIRARATLARQSGQSGTPYGEGTAARERNIERSNMLTARAKRDIKLSQLKSAADKPSASQYAKDRYKYAKSSGMVGKAMGGPVKKMAKGGSVSSPSKRADGCVAKGKTKGRFV